MIGGGGVTRKVGRRRRYRKKTGVGISRGRKIWIGGGCSRDETAKRRKRSRRRDRGWSLSSGRRSRGVRTKRGRSSRNKRRRT